MPERSPLNVLFVCSLNRWRSPTAENLFRSYPGIHLRSAGTSSGARKLVNLTDVDWADLILVMEDKHASRLKKANRQAVTGKDIRVLDIPDEYRYMDPDLIQVLQGCVTPIIEARLAT